MDYNKSTINFYSNKSENLTDESSDEDNFEWNLSIAIAVIYSFTFIVGLIGNSLVVLTIITHKRMRNSTNLLILNLAIADLIFIMVCVPFNGLNSVLQTWYFGKFTESQSFLFSFLIFFRKKVIFGVK
jgi:allatostatin receptor